MKKTFLSFGIEAYIAPAVEVYEVASERGFEQSGGSTIERPGDGGDLFDE